MAEPSPKSSPGATPKRKRSALLPVTPTATRFSFDPGEPAAPQTDDGSSSPASKVAHRFRGLALGGVASGSGVRVSGSNDADGDSHYHHGGSEADDEAEGQGASKRPRPDNDTPDPVAAADRPAAQRVPAVDVPAVHGLAPGRRRAGTPPLRLKRSPSAAARDKTKGGAAVAQPSVADPVRAALTWHEDEITIYDPDDEDDDGTGINGVGFKPTPALAQARTMRRRQQMAEYRRREENEARASRSQRRHGGTLTPSGGGGGGGVKKRSPTRRVRFVDVDSQKTAVTTA